jgi:hypothetical protein
MSKSTQGFVSPSCNKVAKARLFCPFSTRVISTKPVVPPTNDKFHRPASLASFFSPSRSPIESNNNIKALKSPDFSKHSRARSNRQTAKALSPIAFHLGSASTSGTVLVISSAVSRSSSCSERSNLWSGSFVTLRASSFRPKNGNVVEHYLAVICFERKTSRFEEPCHLVLLLFRNGWKDLRSSFHLSPQDGGLILDQVQ